MTPGSDHFPLEKYPLYWQRQIRLETDLLDSKSRIQKSNGKRGPGYVREKPRSRPVRENLKPEMGWFLVKGAIGSASHWNHASFGGILTIAGGRDRARVQGSRVIKTLMHCC